MDWGQELIQTIAALLALAATMLLISLRGAIKERLTETIRGWLTISHRLSAGDVKQTRWILTALVELRVRTNSDRIFVAQFHNGTTFSSHNPVWRITRTHEVVRPGIAFIAPERRAVQVSQWVDVVAPLFGDEILGITKICGPGDPGCEVTVFRMDIAAMPDSPGKQAILLTGTTTGFIAPLCEKDQVVGYLGVEFCDEQNDLPADLNSVAWQIARSTKVVNYLLNMGGE